MRKKEARRKEKGGGGERRAESRELFETEVVCEVKVNLRSGGVGSLQGIKGRGWVNALFSLPC